MTTEQITTIDQPFIDKAMDVLIEDLHADEDGYALVLNPWSGLDLLTGDPDLPETLRITREDPGGDFEIHILDVNGVLTAQATVSPVSPQTIAAIAYALWTR